MVAQSTLHTLMHDFYSFSGDMDGFGSISIQNYGSKALAEITQLKELAATADVDLTSCLSERHQLLNQISSEKRSAMRTCMADVKNQVTGLVSDSKYVVDVIFNKVEALQFQINQCSSDVCLEQIIQVITLDSVKMVEQIEVEVDSATELVGLLRVETYNCRETHVSEFIASSDVVLQEIRNCANEMLS